MQQTNLSDIKTLIHEYPDKMTRSKQSLKKIPQYIQKKKTLKNFILLKKMRVKSKFLIKNSKKQSWKNSPVL